jgi:ADP-ribose pyrophosphatase YjhB (NUDIX family)
MDGQYALPSGHLEDNEPPSVAAAREIKEEIGVTVHPQDLKLVHCAVYRAQEGDHDRLSLFFKAKTFSGEPKNMEPHKCDDLKWVDSHQLPTNTTREVRNALEKISKHEVYSEVYS